MPDTPAPAVPAEAELRFTVTDDDTAAAVGSGSLPVLGTPRLLAWMEAATCAALEADLPDGSTSVGTRVSLEHRAPSPVGATVVVTARRSGEDAPGGRRARFAVHARHRVGDDTEEVEVATGEVVRAVVEIRRFLHED
ncbi:thioesterase [uncultured Nocardioides sp.]|uniref:thioesterase family protein n=1 Tax=uncultured Nocardioides sp. TaxID=198441 RepID=UPI002617971D|nr:thioesterase [uncultured Nocardioides sp.]